MKTPTAFFNLVYVQRLACFTCLLDRADRGGSRLSDLNIGRGRSRQLRKKYEPAAASNHVQMSCTVLFRGVEYGVRRGLMDGGSIECCMSLLVAEKFLFTAGIKASTIARVACAGAGAGKGEHGSHALFKCGSLQFGQPF